MRKTLEEEQYDYITSLIEDHDFNQPTISYLTKCHQIKLPILCDKCLEAITTNEDFTNDADNNITICEHLEEDDSILKPVVGNYLSYLTPCGTCEYNKKLCILYNNRKKSAASDTTSPNSSYRRLHSSLHSSQSTATTEDYYTRPVKRNPSSLQDYYTRPNKNGSIQSSRPQTAMSNRQSVNSKKNYSLSAPVQLTGNVNKKRGNSGKKVEETEKETPMVVGDIRYNFTKRGLEVKRLSSKNSLIIDVFTQDVCQDNTDKTYSEWMNRQKEDENRKNQKFPSQIYEKQLQEVLANFKKGPLPYEVWARQSYEILILQEKIKKAKKLENADKIAKKIKAKEQERCNAFEMWKINKEFAKYAAESKKISNRKP